MSDEPEVTRAKAKGRGSAGELASSAVLIVSVVVVLVLGRALQTSPDAVAETTPSLPSTLPPLTLAAGTDPEPPPAAPVQTPPPRREAVARKREAPETLPPLAARAAADLTRLGAHRGAWTAQILLACKTETVERLLEREPSSSELFVVPVEFRGDSCFRVCWGSYPTSKDAAAAGDRPASLLGEPVRALTVEEALR